MVRIPQSKDQVFCFRNGWNDLIRKGLNRKNDIKNTTITLNQIMCTTADDNMD